MTRTRIRLGELVIRGVQGRTPSPAEIERALEDALARELAGAAPAEPRHLDRLDARVGAGTGLTEAAGAAARSIAASTRGRKP